MVTVLILRVVAEARDDGIEAFPSGSEIDNRGEYGGILVEEELHPRQRANTTFFSRTHLCCRSDGLTREMSAATVRVETSSMSLRRSARLPSTVSAQTL